ncbi:MAG: lipopolysaccharide transport periplasmic protein LptA [Halioglobus sp.]|nr:lipopolysaccharide transport periplasmic protein LptA [Halioglobus sp.]
MSDRPSKLKVLIRIVCTSTLSLLLYLTPAATYALPDDRDQPIHITADKAVRDEKKGLTVYSGNVKMTQGSMELESDVLTIYHPSEEVEKFVAQGNPAKMRQQPEIGKGIVHAHANIIEYFRLEDRVHLQTEARIEQDGSVVDGDTIDYFIAKELVQAQSNANEKVEVVIQPSPQKSEGDKSTQPQDAMPLIIDTPLAEEDTAENVAEQENP